MDWHKLLEGMIVVAVPAVVGLLWRLSRSLVKLGSDVGHLTTNDIPHIAEDVQAVSTKLDRHLEWHIEHKEGSRESN